MATGEGHLSAPEGEKVAPSTPRTSRKLLGLQTFFHHLDEAYEKQVATEKLEHGGVLNEEQQLAVLGSEPVPFDISSSSDESESDSEDSPPHSPSSRGDKVDAPRRVAKVPLERIGRASSVERLSLRSASPHSPHSPHSPLASPNTLHTHIQSPTPASPGAPANRSGSRVLLSSQPRSYTLLSTSSNSSLNNSTKLSGGAANRGLAGRDSAESAKRASAVGSLTTFWENLNEKERSEADRLRSRPSDVGKHSRINIHNSGLQSPHAATTHTSTSLTSPRPLSSRTETPSRIGLALNLPNSPIPSPRVASSSPRIYQDEPIPTSARNALTSPGRRPTGLETLIISSAPATTSASLNSQSPRSHSSSSPKKASLSHTDNSKSIDHGEKMKQENFEASKNREIEQSSNSETPNNTINSSSASTSTQSASDTLNSSSSSSSKIAIGVNTKKSKSSRSSKTLALAIEGLVESDPASPSAPEETRKSKRSSRKKSSSPRTHGVVDPNGAASGAQNQKDSSSPISTSDAIPYPSTGSETSTSADISSLDANTPNGKHAKSTSRKISSISAEGNRSDISSHADPRAVQSDVEGDIESTKERTKKKNSSKNAARANSASHISSKERISHKTSIVSSANAVETAENGSKNSDSSAHLSAFSSPQLNISTSTPVAPLRKGESEVVTSSSKYAKTSSKSEDKTAAQNASTPAPLARESSSVIRDSKDKKKKSKRGSSKSSKDLEAEAAAAVVSNPPISAASSPSNAKEPASPEVPMKAGRKKKKSSKTKKYENSGEGSGGANSGADGNGGDAAIDPAVSGAVATTQALTAQGGGQIELGKLKSFFANWESKAMTHSWEINPQEIEFVELIGEGTSCAVYKGTYRGQEVALKVLKDINKKQLTNFVKEFDIVSVFRSPHVVFFFGACIEPVPVMVLGLCSKGSLYDVLKRPEGNGTPSITWTAVVKVCLSTLRGLDSLHKWKPQILHRDLKSRNILIEDDWAAKLCDFGESRYNTGTNIDTLCKIRGTYAYISPEVYFGQSFTPKSDVYAFGVILWELCNRCVRGTYQAPFAEYKTLIYDFQIIVQASRKGMRPTIAPGVPNALANIIRLCWDHEPANRPSAAQLLKFFEEIASDTSNPLDWDKARNAFSWPPPGGPGRAGAAPITKGD